MYKENYLVPILLLVLVVALWRTTWYILHENPDKGQLGDMFGSVNALFSGLAFAGIIYTILLQHKELGLQRKELELTRSELTRTADAAQQQTIYFNQQQNREDLYRIILKINKALDYWYENRNTQSGQTLSWVVSNHENTRQNSNVNKFFDELKDLNTETYKIVKAIEAELDSFRLVLKAYENASWR